MHIRGLKAALNSSGRFKYKPPEDVVDHLVIGGGVVGLAIARLLTQKFPEKTTYLIERHATAGEETSSRNSEVIHAGLYYPSNSLKETLCLRGRHLLYKYCETASVPFRRTGKLVVALPHQVGYVEALHRKAEKLQWPSPPASVKDDIDEDGYPPNKNALPTQLLSGGQARELEPNLAPEIAAALLSTETGIVDSHTLMESLERDVMDSENGDLVYSTTVVRVDPYEHLDAAQGTPSMTARENGWVLQMVTADPANPESSPGGDALLARSLINTSGLSANLVLNALLTPERKIPMYYARGSYASYSGRGTSRVSRLLYPCPDRDKKSNHAFQSLGTHLTLDLSGNVRFGPDLQWISPSGDTSRSVPSPAPDRDAAHDAASGNAESFSFAESDIDFWKRHLVPDESQLSAMYEAVRTYLPDVEREKFKPDYVGIRPKLVPPWGGFQDFVIRKDYPAAFLRNGRSGPHLGPRSGGPMISLMGIESPGLTASLSIAERVVSMLERV